MHESLGLRFRVRIDQCKCYERRGLGVVGEQPVLKPPVVKCMKHIRAEVEG